jgi:hypothetical protein
MRQVPGAFAEPAHRLPIALKHVIGHTPPNGHLDERLKGIKAQVRPHHLDGARVLARMCQGFGVSIVNEIGIEREGSHEFGDCGVVPALVDQNFSKLKRELAGRGSRPTALSATSCARSSAARLK